MLPEKKLQNPTAWAYKKLLHGKHVNPVQLVSMFNRHHEREQLELIEQICTATDQVAVSSSLLTRRQREKYQSKRIKHGRKVFYMFNALMCPADIGAVIDLSSHTKIYIKEGDEA